MCFECRMTSEPSLSSLFTNLRNLNSGVFPGVWTRYQHDMPEKGWRTRKRGAGENADASRPFRLAKSLRLKRGDGMLIGFGAGKVATGGSSIPPQFTQVKQGEPTEQTSSTAALLQVLPTVNEVTAEVVKVVVEEVKTLAC